MAGRATLFIFSLSFSFVRLVERSPDILPAEYRGINPGTRVSEIYNYS